MSQDSCQSCQLAPNYDHLLVPDHFVSFAYRGQGDDHKIAPKLVDSGYIVEINSEEAKPEKVKEIQSKVRELAEQGIYPYAYCDNANLVREDGIRYQARFLSSDLDGSPGHPGNIWDLPCIVLVDPVLREEGEDA